jgi:dGTPase
VVGRPAGRFASAGTATSLALMTELAGWVADAFEARVRDHEERWLSPLAVRSYETRGRVREEEPCRLRTPFQRDRDRIVHSKAFRRLRNKTQVFIDPGGDHFRTRITHTVETTGISRGVARALGLNEDLVEAIGLGHDLGHTPFGHTGEEILNHTGPTEPETLEGKVVRIVDRVAYINHDIDDALRAGVLTPDELPRAEVELLGETGSRRIDALVHDLVETSQREGDIRQSEEIGTAMLALRTFMFDRVYLGPHTEAQHERARDVVSRVFIHLADHPDQVPETPGDLGQRIADYVAGMTDRFALAYADRL